MGIIGFARRVFPQSCVVAVTLVTAIAPLSWAEGFRNPPTSTPGIARSSGNSTLADDASAIGHNPANLAFVEELSALASLTFGFSKKTFKPLIGGDEEETSDNWAPLPSINAAWPIRNSDLVAGVGISAPYGRSAKYDDDVPFRFSSPTYGLLGVIDVQPSIAARFGDVLIGVGANVYYSTVELRQFVPWSEISGETDDPVGKAEFEADGTAFGGTIGITWQASERQRIALTYKTPFEIEYEGDFEVSNVPDAGRAIGATSSSDFDSEIKFPSIVTLGYGIEFTDAVRVGFEIEWLEQSRLQDIPIDISNNNVLLPFDAIPQDWDDNWRVGAGIDWQVSDRWITRAGLIYIESPTPTRTTLPIGVDDNFLVLSFGFGYAKDRYSVEFAYDYSIFNDDLEVRDSPDPTVNGDYKIASQLISISYGIKL